MSDKTMHPLINQEKQKLARQYKKEQRILSIFSYIISAFFVFILLYTEISQKMVDFLTSSLPGRFFALLVYFAVIYFLYNVLTFPLVYLDSYRVEHKYQFSTQRFKAWFIDWIKSFLINFILGAIIFEIIYFVTEISSNLWWLWLSLIMILFSVILANIFPVVILPLFYRTSPLKNTELIEKIKELAHRAKVNIKEIASINLSSKSTKANAAVVGLGNSKRILLGDNLMNNFSKEEILSALAHEIIHYREHHTWWLICWQSMITIGLFYTFYKIAPYLYNVAGFNEISDPAAFPLFITIFVLLSLIIKPLSAAISRHYEIRADKGAMILTGDPDSFVSLIAKFCNQQLVIAYPNAFVEWYSYRHPSPGRRIKFALKWQKCQASAR